MNIKEYATQYQSNLLNDIVLFWLKNSTDKEYGGYFSCLDREGEGI